MLNSDWIRMLKMYMLFKEIFELWGMAQEAPKTKPTQRLWHENVRQKWKWCFLALETQIRTLKSLIGTAEATNRVLICHNETQIFI